MLELVSFASNVSWEKVQKQGFIRKCPMRFSKRQQKAQLLRNLRHNTSFQNPFPTTKAMDSPVCVRRNNQYEFTLNNSGNILELLSLKK